MSHAGAARWAYNLALSAKIQARLIWEKRVLSEVMGGSSAAEARKAVKVRTPTATLIDKARVRVRGTDRSGAPCTPDWGAAQDILVAALEDEEVASLILERWAARCADPSRGIQPWAADVPNSVIQRGEKDADRAWNNWMDSVTGRRSGRRVGFPRFHGKGDRESFYLTNTECRVVTGRRIRLGGILGEVRTHQGMRRLVKALNVRRGRVMGVTVAWDGRRWFASVLVEEQAADPRPTRRQVSSGAVGVSIGIEDHRIVLSTGEAFENPRLADSAQDKITRRSRKLARTGWITDPETGRRRPSRRRVKARRSLARAHAEVAARRQTATHAVSRRIVDGWATVVVEDLDVVGLTASARGRRGRPGRGVKAKTAVNRATLDVAPGELRRQIEYKAEWSGTVVEVVDPVPRPGCPIHGATAKPDTDAVDCSCGLVADRETAARIVDKAR
jgi:putative transposase